MKFLCSLIFIIALVGCAVEPSASDLKDIVDQKNKKIKLITFQKKILGVSISDVLGVNDIQIVSVEKIKCEPEVGQSKVYYCDVVIKYTISVNDRSIIDFVGFSGDQVESHRLKLIKIDDKWEVLDDKTFE